MPGKRHHRPQSDDVVDLHVFLVPLELWIGKYRTAYNNAVLQATSAGFIRVPSEHRLTKVREAISDQLEVDVIPEEFVFLRSVGRCLAAVNLQQEEQLKAKHFLPPIAFSPELFLLPCSHSDLTTILSKQSNDVYIAGQTVPITGDADYDSFLTTSEFQSFSDSRETSLDSRSLPKEANERKESIDQKNDSHASGTSDETDLRHQFIEGKGKESKLEDESNATIEKWWSVMDQSEMLSHVPKPVKKTSTMSEKFKNFGILGRSQSALPTIQVIQAETPANSRKQERMGLPTPLPSGRVIPKTRTTQKESTENRKKSKDDASEFSLAVDDHNDDNSFGDDEFSPEDFHESFEHSEFNRVPFGADVTPANQDIEKEERISQNGHSINLETEKGKENVDEQRNTSKPAPSPALYNDENFLEDPNRDASVGDSLLTSPREQSKNNRERRLKMELERKKLEEKKRNAAEGATKMMQEMDDLLRKKKLEEEKRKRQEEEVKKMMKAAEEEKKIEIERLKEEAKAAREEKAEVQKRREAIVKLAKELQSKIQTKTSKDTNMWKKKYQTEAERTTELEEELNRLRTDLDVQHKKLLGTLDGKAYPTNQKAHKTTKSKAPSQLSNHKIQLQRLQQEVESLKQRVDETRVKLSAERKMRAIAFQELKELRNQALEKKINAALSSRRFPGVRPINGNVTA